MNAHETTDSEIRELSEIELDRVTGGAVDAFAVLRPAMGGVAAVQFAILDNHAS